MRTILGGVLLTLSLMTLPVVAQEAEENSSAKQMRLADIRIELQNLDYSLQILRWELVQSNNDQLANPTQNQTSILDRVDEIELEIRNHINRIEELEYRINQEVASARLQLNNILERVERIDNEKPIAVGVGEQVPAEVDTQPLPETPFETPSSTAMSSEEVLYNQALEQFLNEEYQQAAILFGDFIAQNPSSDRNVEVYFYIGEAYAKLGDWQKASKSFLESYILDGYGPRAPSTLYRLGQVMGEWEKIEQSCVMFQNLIIRFPQSIEAERAQDYINRFECDQFSSES